MDPDLLEKAKAVMVLDEAALDQEWLKQPRLTLRWALAEADARNEVNQKKAKLDLVEARIKRAVRCDPTKFDLKEKPTEGSINEVVAVHTDYLAALEDLNDAKHAQDQLAGVVAALTDRRRALERLVELKQIDYYGEPRPKGGASREAMADGLKKTARQPLERTTKAE